MYANKIGTECTHGVNIENSVTIRTLCMVQEEKTMYVNQKSI